MDATCKVQDNIHVFRLVHNMCPGFWVHIKRHPPAIYILSMTILYQKEIINKGNAYLYIK